MPAAWVSAGAAVLGAMNSGDSKGGTTTESRDPWLAAQPWMRQNLQTGQNLQNHYQQNPFNQQQLGAYHNLSQGNDYVNQVVPSLLQQMSQPQGFNRANPTQGPRPFNFASPGAGTNLGFGGVQPQAPWTPPANPFDSMPAAAPAAPVADPMSGRTRDYWENLPGRYDGA